MENSMEVPQKTKNRITISFSNPTPEHISGQNHNSKRHMHHYAHSNTIHSSQDRETTWMFIEKEWMMNMWYIYIHNWIRLNHKKNEIMKNEYKEEWNNAICTNVDATRDNHTQWNQSERER